jgi:hypothetical protein
MILSRNITADAVSNAIIDAVNNPKQLAHIWLAKYGYIYHGVNANIVRQQLVEDFKETYHEFRVIADSENSRR